MINYANLSSFNFHKIKTIFSLLKFYDHNIEIMKIDSIFMKTKNLMNCDNKSNFNDNKLCKFIKFLIFIKLNRFFHYQNFMVVIFKIMKL